MENYLEISDDTNVEVKALELLMEPEESGVCLRYILAHAKGRGSRIFEIYSTKEETDHLVASRNRWLENEGKRCSVARKVAKRVARRKIRRYNGKGAAVS